MITKDDVLRVIRMLRWVTRLILSLFFGGGERRIKALEKWLPKLEREGRLYSLRHRGEKVYSIARQERVKPVSMDHEIACADILVRLWRCRMEEGEIVPERAFRSFGIVPENGIRYSKERNTMLITEYESRKDFMNHRGVMKSKITRYRKYLPAMEAKFQRNITVLFVIDIERSKVREFVERMGRLLDETDFSGYDGSLEREVGSLTGVRAGGEDRFFPFNPCFFFTDYQTFKNVPIGDALTAKIYFWNDGNEWRLTNND
jgi:hypothetical protein